VGGRPHRVDLLGIPLAAGYLTRRIGLKRRGETWYRERFLPRIGPFALYGLLFAIVMLFAIQGDAMTSRPLDVVLIAVPLLVYFFVMFFASFWLGRALGLGYPRTSTLAFTAASNNFELACRTPVRRRSAATESEARRQSSTRGPRRRRRSRPRGSAARISASESGRHRQTLRDADRSALLVPATGVRARRAASLSARVPTSPAGRLDPVHGHPRPAGIKSDVIETVNRLANSPRETQEAS
jgi:hypothetical protein